MVAGRFVFLAALFMCAAQVQAATFTLTSTGDGGDATPGDGICADGGGACTFRAAIEESNAFLGTDSIEFAILPAGAKTITPASAYPQITEPVVIDGTTQPGFSTTPIIELDGSSVPGSADGLSITAGSSTVRALVVNSFSFHGIRLDSGGGNVIEGCFIGTDIAGLSGLGNARDGVFVSSSPNNTIGGTGAGQPNVISGNGRYGVRIKGASATGNVVVGNNIGTDLNAALAIGNVNAGVLISDASNNVVGGTALGAENVISGNGFGVLINVFASSNVVLGNLIGTDAAGTVALGNGLEGVFIDEASGNTIGGAMPDSGNVISANGRDGVEINGASASGNRVAGNYIGTDVSGGVALANAQDGVRIDGAPSNTIGGSAAGTGNVVSGNVRDGVLLISAGATGNVVEGNLIGTNAAGSGSVPNVDGVRFDNSASGNTIGGVAAGAENVISGNTGFGVRMTGASASNVVLGNLIGTDGAGAVALGNGLEGVFIDDTAGNTIGGAMPDSGNVISGNGQDGVEINGGSATGNRVAGNYIGTDVTGGVAVANGQDGVRVEGAPSNTIGGSAVGAGNVISGNVRNGVLLISVGATGNVVEGNLIGTDAAGSGAVPNVDGVRFDNSSSNNTFGGTAAGAENVISGNSGFGVRMTGASASNVVLGNLIGTNGAGTVALGNLLEGVFIDDSAGNTIGGAMPDSGNVISGNGQDGVEINGGSATGNRVAGNYIGTDIAGGVALANAQDGVRIDGAPSNTIGGSAAGTGNVVSGNIRNGVLLISAGATGNVVEGNLIGTDDTGSAAVSNVDGVRLDNGASNNTIGGVAAGAENVISGNSGFGVYMTGTSASNVVLGNLIGTDGAGAVALGNGLEGVFIDDTPGNTIGGAMPDSGNVISGNGQDGVEISGASASGNRVAGNYIGTDVLGGVALANGLDGVRIEGAPSNTIGGSAAGTGNVVSGNVRNGVLLISAGATGNVVEGNLIGTDDTGSAAVSNVDGVRLDNGASNNTIGGVAAGAENVISGNSGFGVYMTGTSASNVVLGNLIGTDGAGAVALGNGLEGVFIDDTPGNTIGGAMPDSGNVISGNGQDGVEISGASASGNRVAGNYIGTDVLGGVALANGLDGVRIEGAPSNTIGGSAAGTGNVVSGNVRNGVLLISAGATGNVVEGNLIGTDDTGSAAVSNVDGVRLDNGASNNTIGGVAAGAENVISGNTGFGVNIVDGSTLNVVLGNLIGTDGAGTVALGNGLEGVFIDDTPGNTIGGAMPDSGNVISGNGQDGVEISGASASGNRVAGNYIGTDVLGGVALANGLDGVRIEGAPSNTIGGSAAGTGNVVSGNVRNGVLLISAGATENVVEGNLIGTDGAGSAAVPNVDGIRLDNGASSNTIGGVAAGAENVISGNTGFGVNIVDGSTLNVVLGNLIGTDGAGTVALGNGLDGILIEETPGTTVGGAMPDSGNVISGNGEDGVEIRGGGASANRVAGNYIGTDVTGLIPLGNSVHGVRVSGSASDNLIGGTQAGVENTVAHNGVDGVRSVDGGTGNAVLSNLIHANTGLGVDLGVNGVNPNDPGDSDTGPNNLQNYPVLTAANSTTDEVSGDLNSTASTTFRVEIFGNSACDPSNFGEGETFLTFADVTTNGSGDVSFTVSIPGGVSSGDIFTATATDPSNNTSEFSQCIAANSPPELAAIGNQSVNEGDTEFVMVTAMDPDGDIPELIASNLPPSGFATFMDNLDGTGTLTLAPTFTDGGSYSGIVITARDPVAPNPTDSETIAISANEINQAPELAAIGNQSVNEGDAEFVTVTAMDPDGDIPELIASNLPPSGFATFMDNLDGTGTLTLAPTFTDGGSYSGIVITARDPVAPNPTDSETIAISVNEINQAPVLDPVGNQSVNEGDIEVVTVTATDPDGDIPELTASNLPPSGFATFVDNLDGSGTLTLAPTFTDGGSYSGIVITARDPVAPNPMDSETIAISVNEINQAPVLDPVGNQSVNEGDTEFVMVTAMDPDGDIPELIASNLPPSGFATFMDNLDGTGTLTLAPTFTDGGSYSGIVITARDPVAPNPMDSETIAISVNEINQAPVLDPVGNQSVNEGDVEVVTVTATDPDGTTPNFSEQNLPAFASLVDNLDGSATLTMSPTFADGGSYGGIVITATDGSLTDDETIAISVNEINPPPVLDPVGDQELDEGETLDKAVSASDPDGTIPALSADNLPSFASFTDNEDGTGNLHLEPGFLDAGVYPNVEITAMDAVDPTLTDTELITITVNEALKLSVITGGHKVIIGKKAHVLGDILSGDGVKILKGKKKKPGEIDGSIEAEGNAAIHSDNHITGDVTLGGKLRVGKRVVIDGTVTEHADVDEVILPFIEFPVDGKGRDIKIKKKKTLDLPPNGEDNPTYGRLKAEHHSTLILHSGTYNFSDRFVMKHHAQLVFELDEDEPVTINIKRGLHMGHHTEVVVHNGDAADVLFNITGPGILNEEHGDDEDDDDWDGEDEKGVKDKDSKRDRDRHPRLASRILHKAVFQGTIVSPHGKVRVGHHTAMKGALIAYKVRLFHDVEFSGVLADHLEFSSPPPSAKTIAGLHEQTIPEDFEFPPNYPNPFNPETTIPFAVPDIVYVSIEIYDVLGQRVRTLVDDEMPAGNHSVMWNGRDDAGRGVASGVYLYRIISGEFVSQRKLMLVR